MKTESLSKWLHFIMVGIFAVFIAAPPILAVTKDSLLLKPFLFAIVLAVAIRLIAPLSKKISIKKTHSAAICIILSVICLIFKFAWVYKVRIVPAVDYETYFEYAKSLAENYNAPNRYIALFPHIFGYSWFLSFFIKIFGAGELVAPIVNVALSVVSGVFLFKIAEKLVDIKAAVLVYLFWIVCPSQTLYNSLVLSDLFYTTMMLAFILLLTKVSEHEENGFKNRAVLKSALLGALGGLLLRAVNIARPIAAIFLIAAFIWLFVLRISEWRKKTFCITWAPFLALTVIIYAVTSPLWNSYVENRLGEEPATLSGYNIKVGFNMDSLGSWNLDDSILLSDYNQMPGVSAVWAQEQMLEEAKEYIKNTDIDYIRLLGGKLKTFSGSDDTAVYYLSEVLTNKSFWSFLSNCFYYTVIMLVLFSIPSLIKHSRKTAFSVVLLYPIGLILAQMLVEVAGRYHYSIIPMLVLLAPYGIFKNFKTKE